MHSVFIIAGVSELIWEFFGFNPAELFALHAQSDLQSFDATLANINRWTKIACDCAAFYLPGFLWVRALPIGIEWIYPLCHAVTKRNMEFFRRWRVLLTNNYEVSAAKYFTAKPGYRPSSYDENGHTNKYVSRFPFASDVLLNADELLLIAAADSEDDTIYAEFETLYGRAIYERNTQEMGQSSDVHLILRGHEPLGKSGTDMFDCALRLGNLDTIVAIYNRYDIDDQYIRDYTRCMLGHAITGRIPFDILHFLADNNLFDFECFFHNIVFNLLEFVSYNEMLKVIIIYLRKHGGIPFASVYMERYKEATEKWLSTRVPNTDLVWQVLGLG